MIVSHKYKFVFIKTSKTAGTSTEIALSRFCGDHDIITKNSPEDEKLRHELGFPGPQNHFLPLSDYSLQDWLQLVSKRKRLKLTSHTGQERIKEFIGVDIWDSYYKFCFERNPWDRTVSLYYHFLQDRKGRKLLNDCSISEFIQRGYPMLLKKRGIDLYSINNGTVVDRVCLYENLEAELEYVCNRILGMPGELSLPRAKGNHRKDKRHYHEILNSSDRDAIASMFSREIELFGYCY